MASPRELLEHGQSSWIHGLSCVMLDEGVWPSLIEKGMCGATVEPAELGRAVADTRCYDEQLRRMSADIEDREAYFRLLTADARRACDTLAVCTAPGPERDGWVSAGIDPDSAHDTAAAIAEAARLHGAVDRPNFMVQIPATDEGLPAIEECTARGIPVDATLLYSEKQQVEAANAYLVGLWRFVEDGGDPGKVASAASFPLAWLDAEADRRLASADAPKDLQGTMAIANAKLAHQRQKGLFRGGRWEELVAAGASPQLCRWTATTPSDLTGIDVRYVEGLIGPASISTMSIHLLEAFEDHGTVTEGLDIEPEKAALTLDRLARAGVSYEEVTHEVRQWHLAQLAAEFNEAVTLIGAARERLSREAREG